MKIITEERTQNQSCKHQRGEIYCDEMDMGYYMVVSYYDSGQITFGLLNITTGIVENETFKSLEELDRDCYYHIPMDSEIVLKKAE